jgi:hypothetical protein
MPMQSAYPSISPVWQRKKPFQVVDDEDSLRYSEAQDWWNKSRQGQLAARDLQNTQRNRRALWENGAPPAPFNADTPPLPVDPWRVQHAAQPDVSYPQAGMASQGQWEDPARHRAAADAANEQTRVGLANAPLGQIFSPTSGAGLSTGNRAGNFRAFTDASINARDTIAGGGTSEIPVWSETGATKSPGWASDPAKQAAARAAWDQEIKNRRAAVREKAWGREAARQGRLGNTVGATPQELAFQTSQEGQTERGRVLSAYGPGGEAAWDAPEIARGKNATARYVQTYRAMIAAGKTPEEAHAAASQAEERDGVKNPHQFDGQLGTLMEAYPTDRNGFMRDAAKIPGLPPGAAAAYWDRMTKKATEDTSGGGVRFGDVTTPSGSSTTTQANPPGRIPPPPPRTIDPGADEHNYRIWLNKHRKLMSPTDIAAAERELKEREDLFRSLH